MAMDTPFQQYVRSIASIYDRAAELQRFSRETDRVDQNVSVCANSVGKLIDLLGIEVPRGSARNISLANYSQGVSELTRSLSEAQVWFEFVVETLNTVRVFDELRADNERYPPLVDWTAQGSGIVCQLQNSLVEDFSTADMTLTALKAHIGRYQSILASFTSIEAKLEEERRLAEAALQTQRLSRDKAREWEGEARKAALNAAMLGVLIGALVFGFGGCVYGCTATHTSAKEGTFNGGLLGAFLGLIIGYLTKLSDILKEQSSVERQQMALIAAEARVVGATDEVNAHRAQRPLRLLSRS